MSENDPIIPGCPSIFPHELPGGFDCVEPGGENAKDDARHFHLGETSEKVRLHCAKVIEDCRVKYRRMMADPVRHAEYLKRKAERRHGADGKQTAACKRAQIREKLIPRWERVVADGREEAYIRRTTEENARLFKMWLTNPVMFDEMIRASYKKSRTSL